MTTTTKFKRNDIVIGTNEVDNIPVAIVCFVGEYGGFEWYEIDYKLKGSDRNQMLPDYRLKIYQSQLALEI